MVWYKIWYKIATVIVGKHPVSGDLVPYSNKSHPNTHRNLKTKKKGNKGSVVVTALINLFDLFTKKSSVFDPDPTYIMIYL